MEMDLELAKQYFEIVSSNTPPSCDIGPGYHEKLIDYGDGFYLYSLPADDGSTMFRIAVKAWNLRLFVDCSSVFDALQAVLTVNKFPKD